MPLLLLLAFAPARAAPEPDDAAAFDAWLNHHPVTQLEDFLAERKLNGIVPTRSLLRTATDWRRCKAPQFEIPPKSHWPVMREVVALVAELKKREILKEVDGASAYRNPALNACANGAPRSAHTVSWALDLTAEGPSIDVTKLCAFWRDEGRKWNMGLSRYPSGRIHLDVSGWRTWGADHTYRTSFCLAQRKD
ncbi:hypothetical protein [Ramlibacter sp.]|uniref:hypothetical protein n=1 Tax=Ramlibacter sp. TaxID=1917967 RepID=UPI003D0B55E3